ncbi:pyridoxal-phosphate dependent transferase (putative serine racemase) [Colletotrichum tofieldiae]|uniref:Pyridoxal-phosphate dependent transferase (Putative serine racemase) n=1 Tax=Colletotrichum tofieldiae TaxID=708197 RepID=A0A161VFD8_9PEZI|nr:pyridoxal-phosphate dependent transferase (putative serine racemase) [Colletotrichum tofieldiae]
MQAQTAEQEQFPARFGAIVAPCSGGGLLSGTALSCEGTGIRVFGAEPEFEGGDDGRRGYYSSTRITKVKTRMVADGLVGTISATLWSLIYERGLVSGMHAVSKEEILEAMKLILERLKVWVEPGSAVPLAIALYNEEFRSMVAREAGERPGSGAYHQWRKHWRGWFGEAVLGGTNGSLQDYFNSTKLP